MYYIHWGNEGASRSVSDVIVTSSLESFLLSTYSYAGGKFKHTYTELLFRKIIYAKYDASWFVEGMEFVFITKMANILTIKMPESNNLLENTIFKYLETYQQTEFAFTENLKQIKFGKLLLPFSSTCFASHLQSKHVKWETVRASVDFRLWRSLTCDVSPFFGGYIM